MSSSSSAMSPPRCRLWIISRGSGTPSERCSRPRSGSLWGRTRKVPGLRCFTRSDQGTLHAVAAAKEAAAMTTGSFEGGTTRDVASADRPVGVLANYKALWALQLFGWIVSYADRTLTGPVVAWMIQNKAGFIGDSANPAALGGLVGSMFFLGYMLTQYPGGRLGDRFGQREMIIVSLLWAAVLTAVSGLVAGLVAFVAARVLTGLGEGVFYSNDRTLIMNHTPVE